MTKKDVHHLIQYWIQGSNYDFETAKNLKKQRRYPYALFLLHLSLEKLLKAVIVKQTGDQAPFGHNLLYLLGKTTLETSEATIQIFSQVSEFNIEARYPDEKLKFYHRANKSFTDRYFKEGLRVIQWLKRELRDK